MTESFKYHKRLLYIISKNPKVSQDSVNDIKDIFVKAFRTTSVTLLSTSFIVLYSYGKGYFNYKWSMKSMELIMIGYLILFSSLGMSCVPGYYFYTQLNQKMDEILVAGKQAEIFSEHELKLLLDEKYFQRIVKGSGKS